MPNPRRRRRLAALVAIGAVAAACTDVAPNQPEAGLTLRPAESVLPTPAAAETDEAVPSDTEVLVDDGASLSSMRATQVEYTLYDVGSLLDETFDAGRGFAADADGCPHPLEDDLTRRACVVHAGAFGTFDVTVDARVDGRAWQVRLHRHDTDVPVLVARTVTTTSFSNVVVVPFTLADGSGWVAIEYEIADQPTSVLEVYGWDEDAELPGMVALLPRAVSLELAADKDGLSVTHLYYATDDELCCPRGYLEAVITRRLDGPWVERGTVRSLR